MYNLCNGFTPYRSIPGLHIENQELVCGPQIECAEVEGGRDPVDCQMPNVFVHIEPRIGRKPWGIGPVCRID